MTDSTPKIYTERDVMSTGEGKYSLTFDLPSGGQMTAKGGHPGMLVKSANETIASEVARLAAEKPYREGVEVLSQMALNHFGGSAQAAAQVLLSTYNGYNFQLDLADLCHFDSENFAHAIAVMTGRVKTFEEPHMIIENGQAIFTELEKRYAHLHVSQRYASHYE